MPLEKANYTKTLYFVSPGITDPDIELSRTINYKIFSEGERALLLLNDKNQRLEHSLSRVTTTDCTGEQMMKLYYVPGAGLVLHQDDFVLPEKVQKLQNYAGRSILSVDRRHSTDSVHADLGWHLYDKHGDLQEQTFKNVHLVSILAFAK